MSDLISSYTQLGLREDQDFAGTRSIAELVVGGLSRLARSTEDGGAHHEMTIAVQEIAPRFHDHCWEQFNRGFPLCESPIERRLFPWLLCQNYQCFIRHPRVLLEGETHLLEPRTVAVVPQLRIGNRRTDFALAARREGPARFVIVECDGKEFHADVHKDVARDAELLCYNRVLDIVPLTGSEIHRDAKGAASSASRALTSAWAKTNIATRHKFGSARQ